MENKIDSRQTMNFLIRIGLLVLLIVWCYEILKPFILPLAWAGIIAIAVYPLFNHLAGLLKQRRGLSSVLVVFALLGLLILPMTMLTTSSIDMVRYSAQYLNSETIQADSIQTALAEIPVAGPWLEQAIAEEDLKSVLVNLSPALKAVAQYLLTFSAGLGAMIIQSIVAILIAGFFLVKTDTVKNWVLRLATKIADEKGEKYALLSVKTIGNMAQGILGVAILQSLLAGLGMMLAGVPGTGFWTMMVLIVATIQLPPLLILIPISIYLFSTTSLFVAISFLVLSIAISIIDTPMRAFLMGRDSQTPILVIMLGAIGGLLAFGIVGLFVGAVVLAVGYELLQSWLNNTGQATAG